MRVIFGSSVKLNNSYVSIYTGDVVLGEWGVQIDTTLVPWSNIRAIEDYTAPAVEVDVETAPAVKVDKRTVKKK